MTPRQINWVIVVVYLGSTLWVGRWIGRRQARTLDDYLLAGRRVPWWAASLSIVATETSTLTFVGVPGIAYAGDLTFLQVAIGYVFGRAVVAVLLVPGYFRGRFDTAYEVLAQRFGGRVQTLASSVFVVNRCLADGVRLFATALVLLALLPMPLPVAIALVAGVTLYYTLRGGLKAVIWNDVLQQVVYIGGAGLAAAVLLQRLPGGWAGVSAELAAAGKLRWLDFSLDPAIPYTFWAGLIGGAVLTAATHGTDHMFVQRLLACGSRRGGQLAIVGSGLIVLVQMAFFLWIGALLWAFYSLQPPAVPFATADAAFPRFIAEELPVGLGGLVIAAVFAAAMSTLSSSLNSLASVSTVDLWKRWRRARESAAADEGGRLLEGAGVGEQSRLPAGRAAGEEVRSTSTGGAGGDGRPGRQAAAEEEQAFRVSHRFTIGWAVVLALVAGMARFWGPVLEAGLTITSITFGGVLGIFVVGQTRWQVGQTAASAAMALGIGTLVVVHFIGGLAWPWYTPLGAAITVATAALLARRRPASEPLV